MVSDLPDQMIPSWNATKGLPLECRRMEVLVFHALIAEGVVKEPPIESHAAIRPLKQHILKEPIFEAASSRPPEFFATAMGTTTDLSLGSGFVHGENLLLARAMLRRLAAEPEAQFVPRTARCPATQLEPEGESW